VISELIKYCSFSIAKGYHMKNVIFKTAGNALISRIKYGVPITPGEFSVAQKLLTRVESELRKRKIKKIFVSTEDTNVRAKSFYAKNNFRAEAALRDYYYKGED
jgi:hypothetical protein